MLPLAGKVCGANSLPTITTEEAFCVCHASVTGALAASEVSGSEVKDRMRTWPTFTVVLAWIWPAELVAVKVYVVVCVGLTVAQSFAFRLLPTAGVIEMLVALVTCQHSLVDWPA